MIYLFSAQIVILWLAGVFDDKPAKNGTIYLIGSIIMFFLCYQYYWVKP